MPGWLNRQCHLVGRRIVDEKSGQPPVQEDTFERLAALWKSKLGGDFQSTDDGFRDPEGGIGLVFGVRPAKILVFDKGPFSQTRYRFTA